MLPFDALSRADLFVLTNDTIDYYTFNGTDYVIQAVECEVNGTIANCNGTVVDLVCGHTRLVNDLCADVQVNRCRAKEYRSKKDHSLSPVFRPA